MNLSLITKVPGVTEESHQENNKNLQRHQFHILSTAYCKNGMDSHHSTHPFMPEIASLLSGIEDRKGFNLTTSSFK